MHKSIQFKDITDATIWKDFEENYHDTETFFHSWEWSEFEISMNRETYRRGVYQDDFLVGVILAVVVNAKRGKHLHVRNGPLIHWDDAEVVEATILHIKELALNLNCIYVRVSPLLDDLIVNKKILSKYGFVSCQMHDVDAEVTWVLDITQSEEEIKAGMRKNTRYYINRARKDGVIIEKSTNPDDLVKFWPIFIDTVKRQDWKAYPYEYILNEFKLFAKTGKALLILAKYQDEYIAGSIFIFHKGVAYYHHSGSLTAYRKIPAPYLIQWHAIKEAISRGMKKYNLFGIARTDTPKHPWAGLTFFKKGFGGKVEAHIHAQDLPLSKKYWLTHFFEFGEKKLRGY